MGIGGLLRGMDAQKEKHFERTHRHEYSDRRITDGVTEFDNFDESAIDEWAQPLIHVKGEDPLDDLETFELRELEHGDIIPLKGKVALIIEGAALLTYNGDSIYEPAKKPQPEIRTHLCGASLRHAGEFIGESNYIEQLDVRYLDYKLTVFTKTAKLLLIPYFVLDKHTSPLTVHVRGLIVKGLVRKIRREDDLRRRLMGVPDKLKIASVALNLALHFADIEKDGSLSSGQAPTVKFSCGLTYEIARAMAGISTKNLASGVKEHGHQSDRIPGLSYCHTNGSQLNAAASINYHEIVPPEIRDRLLQDAVSKKMPVPWFQRKVRDNLRSPKRYLTNCTDDDIRNFVQDFQIWEQHLQAARRGPKRREN